MRRRDLLAHGFLLTPLATLLTACGDEGHWPEGMVPFKWDRDNCTRCKMSISDHRFAVQLRGGPKNMAFKFDDIGCATTWRAEKLKEFPWMTEAATRFWVADFDSQGEKWLDARSAYYLAGKTSPMGYNYAAFAQAQTGTVAFEAMCQKTSGMWPADCQPGARPADLPK
ncbi:MAG: nitrous oxide reductase accessory protein NosL [Rhodoferax sp.]|uniref:nitrous oxide reductase accessory protein NosL n=1 Tax=Rhodoferax sp. TaxID=50421 RepID=UPI00301940E8